MIQLTANRWYYVLGKTLHLFKFGNAFRNLAGRADQSRPQSSITDGVIFERNMLVKLCAGQPLLIIVVAGGGLLHVGNACQFSLRFLFGITNNRIGSDSESHRTETFLFSSLRHVSDFRADTIGRISMHDKGITAFSDQFFRRFRFATRVNHWSWL